MVGFAVRSRRHAHMRRSVSRGRLLDSPRGFVTVATIVTRVLLLAAGLLGCGPVQVVGQVSGRTSRP